MGRLVLLVLGLAGCERVLNLAEVPPPVPDAPFFACARETAPSYLCADFDEMQPLVYEAGQASALPTAQAGASYELRAPATSPPGALWIDSQTATYYLQELGVGAPVSKVHASFDLQITRAPSYAFELVEIGMTGTGACTISAQVDAPGQGLRVLPICAGNRLAAQRVLSGVPVGWVHVTMELDTSTARATMAVNDSTVTVDLTAMAPQPGLAKVRAGILYAQATPGGPAVALDGLQMTTTSP